MAVLLAVTTLNSPAPKASFSAQRGLFRQSETDLKPRSPPRSPPRLRRKAEACSRNLGTFYFSGVAPLDWTTPSNGNLWQDGSKTLFDPCPAGWRVPKGGAENLSPWLNFSLPETLIPNAPTISFVSGANAGCQFYRFGTSGDTAWYPAASFREPDGYIRYTGESSLLWTTSRMDEYRKHDFYLYTNGVRCSGGDVNTYGLSVRCLRE